MAVLTTGSITVTVSGTSRQMHMKEHVVNMSIVSGEYPSSGIPLPTNKEAFDYQHRLDYLALLDEDADVAHVLKLDKDTQRLHVFKTQLTSGNGQSLIEASSGTGIPALDLYFISRGY